MKKDKQIENFFNKTGYVKMSELEKNNMRKNLEGLPIPSPFLLQFRAVIFKARYATVALASFLFLVGTAGAADSVLPNNPLYAIKVAFNEPIARIFAVSEKSKKEFELTLAERRINEIEELSKTGELTAEIKKDVENRLRNSLEKTRKDKKLAVIAPRDVEDTRISSRIAEVEISSEEAMPMGVQLMTAEIVEVEEREVKVLKNKIEELPIKNQDLISRLEKAVTTLEMNFAFSAEESELKESILNLLEDDDVEEAKVYLKQIEILARLSNVNKNISAGREVEQKMDAVSGEEKLEAKLRQVENIIPSL